MPPNEIHGDEIDFASFCDACADSAAKRCRRHTFVAVTHLVPIDEAEAAIAVVGVSDAQLERR
jgi:hypothetical protein